MAASTSAIPQKNYTTGVHKGSPYIKCHTCNRASFNANDIRMVFCPWCKVYHQNMNLDNLEYSDTPRVRCSFCNALAYKQDNSEYYMCSSGHKNKVYGIEEKQVKETPKETKKKRHISHLCPTCGEIAEVQSEVKSKTLGRLYRNYVCGHKESFPLTAPPLGRDEKWKHLIAPYQCQGVEFIEDSDYQCAVNDEVGLGKTIQSLMAIRYNYEALTPTLYIVEASKVYDWKNEFALWVGDKYSSLEHTPIIHTSGQFGLVPGFRNHIISMSLLGKPKVLKSIIEYGFKCVIVDESHSFSNEDADRTYALQQIAKAIPHYIFLSATPVVNKIDEFFTTLNILRPSHWPSKANLIAKCNRTASGKVLGLRTEYRDRFFEWTKSYILRRTKKQVGLQLPKLSVHKIPVNVATDAILVKEYNKTLDFLETTMQEIAAGLSRMSQIIGIFAKLRHLAGVMKVKSAIRYAKEFLDNTDPEYKLCLGVHHKDVMEYIAIGLAEYNPILASDESPSIKMDRIEKFKRPESRLAIFSILGMGQGHNIQFCKNTIQVERMWNRAKETQFHGRFHRIVKDAEGNIVTNFTEDDAVVVDILNAMGTMDEYFDAMVDLKGEICDSVDGSIEEVMPDNFMMELAQKLVSSRMKLGI